MLTPESMSETGPIMHGYHELAEKGRREIHEIEG